MDEIADRDKRMSSSCNCRVSRWTRLLLYLGIFLYLSYCILINTKRAGRQHLKNWSSSCVFVPPVGLEDFFSNKSPKVKLEK